jgi:hypothetical protein
VVLKFEGIHFFSRQFFQHRIDDGRLILNKTYCQGRLPALDDWADNWTGRSSDLGLGQRTSIVLNTFLFFLLQVMICQLRVCLVFLSIKVLRELLPLPWLLWALPCESDPFFWFILIFKIVRYRLFKAYIKDYNICTLYSNWKRANDLLFGLNTVYIKYYNNCTIYSQE